MLDIQQTTDAENNPMPMDDDTGAPTTGLSGRVLSAIKGGRWQEVIDLLDDCSSERDADPLLGLHYFVALLHLGQAERARDLYCPAWKALPRFHVVMRRYAVAPLVKARQWSLAAETQRRVVDAMPESVEEACSLSSLLVQSGAPDAAEVALQRLPESAIHLPLVIQQRLQIAFRRGDYASAADIVWDAEDSIVADLRTGYLGLLALTRNGEEDEARRIARKIDLTTVTRPRDIMGFASLLYSMGEHDRCLSLCSRALDAGIVDARLHFYTGRILAGRPGDAETVGNHLCRAYTLDQGDLQATRCYSEWLMSQGRFRQAVPVAEKAVAMAPDQATLRVMLARACKHSGDFERAADLMAEIATRDDTDPHWLRQAAAALSQAGRDEEARKLHELDIATKSAALPATLPEGLDDLWDQTDRAAIPQSRFDWAWSLAGDAVRANYEHAREEWHIAAQWGLLADELLLDWFDCRPARTEEAVALLGDLDATRSHLEALHKRGKGVILASAHVGTLYGGALALFNLGLPHKWVASTSALVNRSYAGSLISSIDQTEEQVVRRILKALKEGNLVTIAMDGAMSPAAPRVELAGQSVTYSPFAARIAYKNRIPSVFVTAQWKHGIIEPFCRKLPEPDEGESMDEYAARWKDAYMLCVRDMLSGDPENLRMSGGIWRHV